MNQEEFILMFEAIKKSCVMAIYSGGLCGSPESERDSCASRIRLLTITEVIRNPHIGDAEYADQPEKVEE